SNIRIRPMVHLTTDLSRRLASSDRAGSDPRSRACVSKACERSWLGRYLTASTMLARHPRDEPRGDAAGIAVRRIHRWPYARAPVAAHIEDDAVTRWSRRRTARAAATIQRIQPDEASADTSGI